MFILMIILSIQIYILNVNINVYTCVKIGKANFNLHFFGLSDVTYFQNLHLKCLYKVHTNVKIGKANFSFRFFMFI